MLKGRWISPAPKFERGSRYDSLDEDPVCPQGYQCVPDQPWSANGCCNICASNQLCSMGTIALGATPANQAQWNKCPDGHICDSRELKEGDAIKKCEAGYMCQDGIKMSCIEAREIPINAGYGDIHKGSYCPTGSHGLQFCPQGYYCPADNMTISIPCPEGFFCPLKSEEAYIICDGCTEASLHPVAYPFFASHFFHLIFAFALSLILLYIYKIVKRKKKLVKKSKKLSKLSDLDVNETQNQNDNKNICHLYETNVQTMLQGIERRFKLFSGLSEPFHADRLFDALDTHNTGVLSYEALNTILDLSKEKASIRHGGMGSP